MLGSSCRHMVPPCSKQAPLGVTHPLSRDKVVASGGFQDGPTSRHSALQQSRRQRCCCGQSRTAPHQRAFDLPSQTPHPEPGAWAQSFRTSAPLWTGWTTAAGQTRMAASGAQRPRSLAHPGGQSWARCGATARPAQRSNVQQIQPGPWMRHLAPQHERIMTLCKTHSFHVMAVCKTPPSTHVHTRSLGSNWPGPAGGAVICTLPSAHRGPARL